MSGQGVCFFLADLQNIAEAFLNVLQLEFIISTPNRATRGTLGATITLSLTGKHPSQQIWEDSNSSQARMIQLLLSSPPMNL